MYEIKNDAGTKCLAHMLEQFCKLLFVQSQLYTAILQIPVKKYIFFLQSYSLQLAFEP